MDDRLKSLLYMGVGLASTSNKARLLLEKMEIEGRMSEEEGRRVFEEVLNAAKTEGAGIKDELTKYFQDILEELDSPSRKELNELKMRVEQLEKIIAEKGYVI